MTFNENTCKQLITRKTNANSRIINRFKQIDVYWGYVGTFTGKTLPLWQK